MYFCKEIAVIDSPQKTGNFLRETKKVRKEDESHRQEWLARCVSD